jgi:hypothetical protein
MVFAGSQGNTNAMRNFSPSRLGGYSVGLDLDATQAAAFNSAMQTFQTALARNV